MSFIEGKEDRKFAFKTLERSSRPEFRDVLNVVWEIQSSRSPNNDENGEYFYISPNRPLWSGFQIQAKDLDPVAYHCDGKVIETKRPASLDFMRRMELIPVSEKAMRDVGKGLAADSASVVLKQTNSKAVSVALMAFDKIDVFDYRLDAAEPTFITRTRENTLGDAIVNMVHSGYMEEIQERYIARYVGEEIESKRLAAEIAAIARNAHPKYRVKGSSTKEISEAFVAKYAEMNPDIVTGISNRWISDPDRYVTPLGISNDLLREMSQAIVRNRNPESKESSKRESNVQKQKWIDLASFGVFLGDQRMADGRQRLVLLDMEERGDPSKLRELGFIPVSGSPRYDKGIYYLQGDDQRLRPKALAVAFGIENCPLIEVEISEIERVFREKITEKFGLNVNAITLRSKPLGQNQVGQFVYESPTGRFIRLSTVDAVSEHSALGSKMRSAAFLRATTEGELRACAEGFLWRVHHGNVCRWPDLVQFGKTVFDTKSNEPSDEQMHRLQEAVEAAAYRRFTSLVNDMDDTPEKFKAAFKLANDLYYGLPASRMRTSESVLLQQYSTPLPMSVVTQRLLIGSDDMSGKTTLEPTGGNGGQLNILPTKVSIFAVELDRNRIQAMNETGRINARLGDATSIDFKKEFEQHDGFDFVIANPPFGTMDTAKEFDKLKNIRRLDHYILLRCLEARKGQGRSVFIMGADGPRSNGEIRGGAIPFFKYLYDHYEIHGLTQVDGRLYQRQGAGYDIRLLIVGNKRSEPIISDIPDELPVINDYESLWNWASNVIDSYKYVQQEPVINAKQIGDIQPVFDSEHDSVFVHSLDAKNVVDETDEDISGLAKNDDMPGNVSLDEKNESREDGRPKNIKIGNYSSENYSDTSEESNNMGANIDTNRISKESIADVTEVGESDITDIRKTLSPTKDESASEYSSDIKTQNESAGNKCPWQMTLQEWSREISNAKNSTGHGHFTRHSANAEISKMDRLQYLRYGVTDWASEKLSKAQRGIIKLSPDELSDIDERLRTPISHRDVIDKAMHEGKTIPKEVLEDYPDLSSPPARNINEFQAPYQAASQVSEASTMIPINMAGSTYASLNDLEAQHGAIDDFVASKLQYQREELPRYFSPEQVDAVGLAIKAVEEGRGIINADQTGIGKGRFVATMLRYAKLNNKMPIFITLKPELFTDIFRDINDIGSQDLFKKIFIFNNSENVKKYGTEREVLYPATTQAERQEAILNGMVNDDIDMVMATYSQFMREASNNPKARLLTDIAANNGMLVLDEAHIASGASNISSIIGDAVANSDSVLYASATPLKGVSNFAIYNKIFPQSVDLESLPETLRIGGEALQEAISANMARDGVLIRREHDFSKLVFHTRIPSDERKQRNIDLAGNLAEILSRMAYMAGDVSKQVDELNKKYREEWEEIPDRDRRGSRMQASSMNFGSRLYSLNRQFLLGIKIDDAIETALNDLANGRKPVIAVENTGESLLREVIATRAGVEQLEAELSEIDELGATDEKTKLRRSTIVAEINDAMKNVVLDEPPQYRELLESMLDRMGVIKIQGRYGDWRRVNASSDEYMNEEAEVREMIRAFPDLPLTPIDIIKKELQSRGHPVAEVSGRTVSLTPCELEEGAWKVGYHKKADAVANVAGFQNGKYDAIVITRSGSTGISLHATDRFEDSDVRQRNFIVLQKAANIAEFLQWMGRVNRKDQVVPPIITGLESGLPAELRLTMMHNAKLRKLSANTTSNRDNANLEGENCDLLNDVGDRVALEWLIENPDFADMLDIDLPDDESYESKSSFSQDCPYINKLMGRLMMVGVDRQNEIINILSNRFVERVDELEQRGENPFKIDVFDWRAKKISEEELQSGVMKQTNSTFDEPVNLVTVRFEQDIFPIRSEKLISMVKTGVDSFVENDFVNSNGTLGEYSSKLERKKNEWIRAHLPAKLKKTEEDLSELLERKDVAGAKGAKERAEWLEQNIKYFRPGALIAVNDPFKGEQKGVVVEVAFPKPEDMFLLSQYRMKVVFPGEDHTRPITLATLKSQDLDLASTAYVNTHFGEVWLKNKIESVYREFDNAPQGKLVRTQHLLQGNIFRACELATQQKLGTPILFTDEEGNRQRAVRIRDRISPESVKSMPIGMDSHDLLAYMDAYFDLEHPDSENRYSSFRAFSKSALVDCVVLERAPNGTDYQLSMPGTKSKMGALITDGDIFDVGQKTLPGSLRLRLSGKKKTMVATVQSNQLPELLERLQKNKHVSRFYVPHADHEVIKKLKEGYRSERAAFNSRLDTHEP